MYTAHFGLKEPPFSIAPDPRYLYMSERHSEALAHLLYGISEGGGFVLLTGEVGTGKTTLCHALLNQLPAHVDVAFVFNPRLTTPELLASICDELNIAYPADTASLKVLMDALNRYLLEAHAQERRTVLIIDEAQNLAPDVLEQIRLLTNLETTREKLLQIILIGQPELNELLTRRELRQLAQRVTACYHLEPLSETETRAYIDHRMQIGGRNSRLFSKTAVHAVYKLSGGVPRLVNAICDRALLGAFTRRKDVVERQTVRKAAAEVLVRKRPRQSPQGRAAGWLGYAVAAAMAALALGVWLNLVPSRDRLLAAVSDRLAIVQGLGSGSDNGSAAVDAAAGLRTEAADRADGLEATSSSQASGRDPTPMEENASIETQPVDVFANDRDPATQPSTDVKSRAVRGPSGAERFDDDPSAHEVATPIAGGGAQAASESLSELLATPSLRPSRSSALAKLSTLWGGQPTAQALTCDQAPQRGLRCFSARGSWNNLRYYDRPAVLELVATEGRKVYGVVTALDDQTVSLKLADVQLTLPIEDVEPFWRGAFTLLWKPPEPDVRVIKPGMRGGHVRWLRQRLSRMEGRPVATPDGTFFDEQLKARVITFQKNRALDADGIVGVKTIIHLNTATDEPDVPRLQPHAS